MSFLRRITVAVLTVCVLFGISGQSVAAASTPFRVLILGDSYSAGNGSDGPYSGPRGCWRSSSTWGEQLAVKLRTKLDRQVEITNRACSGAVTNDIVGGSTQSPLEVDRKLETKEFRENGFFERNAAQAQAQAAAFCTRLPGIGDEYYRAAPAQRNTLGAWYPRCDRMVKSQISQITPDFDLVVLTIGGNDAGFARIAQFCLTIPDPAPGITLLRDGPECKRALKSAERLIRYPSSDNFRARLGRVLSAIQARLNPAGRVVPGQVLLLSYPNLSENDYAFEGIEVNKRLLALGQRAEAIQAEVMSTFNSPDSGACVRHRSVFADDTKYLFHGHTLNAPVNLAEQNQSWLWELNGISKPMEYSFHPKPAGHGAEALAAFSALEAQGLNGCGIPSTYVLNRADNGVEGNNLEVSLEGLGDIVERGASLPAGNLLRFSSIWVVVAYEGLTPEEVTRLTAFVGNGGHLYLTGERPCCEGMNASSQQIINSSIVNPDVQVGRLGTITGPFTPNPSAAGSLAQSPQSLTEFTPDAPGGMSGLGNVTGRNVFISNGVTPVAGVWDETDMVTGKGRIVILMDIDWLKQPNRSQYVINVHEFLTR